jgi:hypothetical protein
VKTNTFSGIQDFLTLQQPALQDRERLTPQGTMDRNDDLVHAVCHGDWMPQHGKEQDKHKQPQNQF